MSDETKTETNIKGLSSQLDDLIARNAARRKHIESLDGGVRKTDEERTFLDLCTLADIVRALTPPMIIVADEVPIVEEPKPKKKS